MSQRWSVPLFDQASLTRQAMLSQMDPQQTPDPAAPPARKGIGIAPYAALAGGSLADGISTYQALKRPGTYELNPLLSGGTAEMIAMKGGTTAALLWAMHELAKQGHPTAAKVMGYVGGAALGGLAVNNSRQGK